MHRVFVYGTLKRGLLNHQIIANSRFLGPAATTERFRMIADSFAVSVPKISSECDAVMELPKLAG